jgi:uncharacterized protein YgbK (DUF1537 family)
MQSGNGSASMSSIRNDRDKTMTEMPHLQRIGLAASLRDGMALADHWGGGTRIGLGTSATQDIDIIAPDQGNLTPSLARAALQGGAARYFFSCGNDAGPADPIPLVPVMETLIRETRTGFMAACFAAPAAGRTVYSGHLFQHGKLLSNLSAAFNNEISGRAGLVPYQDVAGGVQAIRRRLAVLKEQGVALALIDAVDIAQCAAVAEACDNLAVTGGPVWMSPTGTPALTVEPHRDVAILAGALDRQTLFQIGAAGEAMPVLQLDFTRPVNEIAASALAWAAAHSHQRSYLIAASAPPDHVRAGIPAAGILADIAAGLAATGTRRFLLAGSDTAATILCRLGQTKLTAGGMQGDLRWLHGQDDFGFLIKPGGTGEKNLFLSQIGPHIRLNAAAE